MGKTKQKRHKATRDRPTGLPSVRDLDKEGESELSTDGCSELSEQINTAVLSIIEKLQSTVAEEKECACDTLANLITKQVYLQSFLQNGLVKVIGPLMVDVSMTIRHCAVGALRNMSVDGGADICSAMVRDDVMTPLVALLHQYGESWVPTGSKTTNNTDTKMDIMTDTFYQAVNLLWNLCENSEVAVNIFNRERLVSKLLPCLKPDIYGITLSVAIAQCLYTVTEDNSELSALLSQEETFTLFMSIVTTSHQTSQQLLLRVLIAGVLYNISGGKLTQASGHVVTQLIQLLAETVTPDVTSAITTAVQLISSSNGVDGAAGGETELTGPEQKEGKIQEHLQEIQHLLTSQQVALELLSNLCYPEDEEEEDWEDLDASSDENFTSDAPMEDSCDEDNMQCLCVSSEVHASLVSCDILPKVLSKIGLPDDAVTEVLEKQEGGKSILNSWLRMQSCALLCIHNMVNALDPGTLGGLTVLHDLWRLSELATAPKVIENMELLEALTSAMRAVIQRLAELNSPKLESVTENDLGFLFEMGHRCEQAQVRSNAVRIISTIGCILAKQQSPHPLLKNIGVFLMVVANKDAELWVVAEALDSIFDTFAEDHTDAVAKEIKLIQNLKCLVPQLKVKIRQQKKQLGEHLPIISTARTNLDDVENKQQLSMVNMVNSGQNVTRGLGESWVTQSTPG